MNRWGSKKLTAAEKLAGMTRFLWECRESALAAVTVDDLVARHGVDRKLAEYHLAIARQQRGVTCSV